MKKITVAGAILLLVSTIWLIGGLILQRDMRSLLLLAAALVGLIVLGATKSSQELNKSKRLRNLINGHRSTALLYAAAKLGLADLLADHPQTSDELASKINAHAPSLHRLLDGLVAIGICSRRDNGQFSLTALGSWLQTQKRGSLRGLAIIYGEECVPVWGDLTHTVLTGETAFPRVFGMSQWEHRKRDSEINDYYNAWMKSFTKGMAESVLSSYDFSPYRTILDVGGGYGALLSTLLKANPKLNGVLFDQPHVASEAANALEKAGVAGRCRVVGGNFFESVPAGADLCILKSVIRDWDDGQSLTILKNIHLALKERGRLLLIEHIIPEKRKYDLEEGLMDIHMMVMTGGCQRNKEEFRALLEKAGFRMTRVIPIRSRFSIIEAVAE